MKRLALPLTIVAAGLAAAFVVGSLELVDRIDRAVDRRFGDWLYVAVVVVLFVAFAVVVLSIAAAVAGRALAWSRQISPNRHGLFAIFFHRGQPLNFNEPGAQSLSALSAHKRPTAPLAQRVIEANYRLQRPANLPELAPPPDAPPEIDYAASLPREVSLYSAPLPRELSLPVGVDAAGRQVAIPLRNLGNVLIGGRPGGGKSELLAGFVAGLARQDATGVRVQIAVADMKLVSFGNIPPDLSLLRWPVAVDMAPAQELIEQVLEEVRRRYALLQQAGVRSLDGYIQRTGEPLPHLVTIIDEIADLSASRISRASFVEVASEIARKGRAAGVTLVMATQRPSSDTLPADLRNLEGVAVAFAVERPEDSRLILGRRGAEMLPAIPGRCLVRMERAVVAQAYLAGLDEAGGHSSFDAFLAGLPRADAVLTPVPARTSIPMPAPAPIPAQNTPSAGIPASVPPFRTDEPEAPYTPEQIAHIVRLYRESVSDRYPKGSLKAVQRAIYPDQATGGHWWYRIRDTVREAGYDTALPTTPRRHRRVARQ